MKRSSLAVLAALVVAPAAPLARADVPPMPPPPAPAPVPSSTVRLTVDEAGSVSVDGAATKDAAALSERLATVVKKDPHVAAVIVAPPKITQAKLIAVVDAVKTAGITRVSVEVSRDP